MGSDDTTLTPPSRFNHRAVAPTGMVMVLIGIALDLLSLLFDGVVFGLLLGAALALILLGVALLSARWHSKNKPRSTAGDNWLPSRDGNS